MNQKFIVLKISDCEKYLNKTQQIKLGDLIEEIRGGRILDGKKTNKYAVVNLDEPYAEEIIEIMKRHGHWD